MSLVELLSVLLFLGLLSTGIVGAKEQQLNVQQVLRSRLEQGMQDTTSVGVVYPRWIGTSPFCAASCADCQGEVPFCWFTAHTASEIPSSLQQYRSSFGTDCFSGQKALCAPTKIKPEPRWIGTSPFCAASCADCSGDLPDCMCSAKDNSQIIEQCAPYRNAFGADCISGQKVLCGPA
jgi:hypothetical protein